jgi:hypothetical protein
MELNELTILGAVAAYWAVDQGLAWFRNRPTSLEDGEVVLWAHARDALINRGLDCVKAIEVLQNWRASIACDQMSLGGDDETEDE